MITTSKPYEFTSSWHQQHVKNWRNWLKEYVSLPIQALEIGSYEGRSAIWLCEHILRTVGSHLICVDTVWLRLPIKYCGTIKSKKCKHHYL